MKVFQDVDLEVHNAHARCCNVTERMKEGAEQV